MRKAALIILILLGLALMFATGVVNSSYHDEEHAAGNSATAWTAIAWTQTTQAQFDAGDQIYQVNTSEFPGDVVLDKDAGGTYYSSGGMASEVLDTMSSGTICAGLFWDRWNVGTNPGDATITMWVRASDTSFDKSDSSPAWINAGTGTPLQGNTMYNITSLPSGRYMQWCVNLTTGKNPSTGEITTPHLEEVRVWYYQP